MSKVYVGIHLGRLQMLLCGQERALLSLHYVILHVDVDNWFDALEHLEETRKLVGQSMTEELKKEFDDTKEMIVDCLHQLADIAYSSKQYKLLATEHSVGGRLIDYMYLLELKLSVVSDRSLHDSNIHTVGDIVKIPKDMLKECKKEDGSLIATRSGISIFTKKHAEEVIQRIDDLSRELSVNLWKN